ncbi:MAG: MoxR family ATPase [Phycisphaeraceae bacterium]
MGSRRSGKVILSNDPKIRFGKRYQVRITAVHKPASKKRGYFEVEYVGPSKLTFDDSIYVDPDVVNKLEVLLLAARAILLDGPQGCGKTVLAGKLAQAMEWELIVFNCSIVFDPTDMLARPEIRSTASGGVETAWVATNVLRTLEAAIKDPTRQFLIFLDEFSRVARPNAVNMILSGIDSTRQLHNPITGANIRIPDNVHWIAAVNTGSQVVGAVPIDPAALDRFAPIKMEYLPEAEELRLLAMRYPEVPKAKISRVVRIANAIRKNKAGRMDLSMRATDEACLLLTHPHFEAQDDFSVILRDSFCSRFDGRWDDPVSDAGTVWRIIEGMAKMK